MRDNKELTPKQIMEDPYYEIQRKKIMREINTYYPEAFPDRSEFEKTLSEKHKLWSLKKANIEERRAFYGKDYKKYLNVPTKSITPIKITL